MGDKDARSIPAPENTRELLALAKAGQPTAIDMLFRRCLPGLRRWARGRLPGYARDLCDTHDLVQDTLLHTLNRLESFEPKERGALDAYLRRAVVNRIRDEIRRATRRPAALQLVDRHADPAPSPLEEAIGNELAERYRAALTKLRPGDRNAIAARLESRRTYREIATLLRKPNANAARVAVSRAVDRLIDEMNTDGTRSAQVSRTPGTRRVQRQPVR
jgi:RNA polymerase sigma factor (sigma-70 family)